ncbi:ABC-type transport auxiliary lipoprotein family protein [Xylophilus sp. ASV27]|uniref:ABC-type transport auxiliary lipoprotein family protein n=1 Tax=Xylophilus sp. ASV27 TaxID=2795129 RepID=UPI001E30F8CD|nr:ABC-type transport auxiliary lipoprotein family protein [Xylophilus sp. ASV27]
MNTIHRIAMPAAALLLAVLAGCSSLPERPSRPLLYDFGPGQVAVQPQSRIADLPPIALADIDASGVLDSAMLMYRLAYTDAQQLQPYALARWTLPPSQLVAQRLRERLGQRRAVLDVDDSASLQRIDGKLPLILRLQLEEFSQIFDSPASSAGVLRLRATLVEKLPEGDRLIAQRLVLSRQPAPTADAAGGAKALATATDDAAQQIGDWLAQAAAP